MAKIFRLNDMIIDGFDITSKLVLEEIDRPLTREYKPILISIPGRDGYQYKSMEKGGKRITLSLRAIPNNLGDKEELQSLYNEVAPHLFKDIPMKLQLRDNPDRYEMVVVDSQASLDMFLGTGLMKVTYLNYEGISLDILESNSTTNNGNIDAPFVLKGTYDGTSQTISVLNSNESLKFLVSTENFKAGDFIVIDFYTGYVTNNDLSAMKNVHVESDIWDLEPGENSIVVTGLNNVEYIHRDRWSI